jgi:NAD(P)-dependent dehydrogenase (short-subunit alcohol dehydrogenase family)
MRALLLTYEDNGTKEAYRMPKPKTMVITGATGMIGEALAMRLARLPTTHLILPVHDPAKGARLADHLRKLNGDLELRIETVDLERKSEIQAFALRLKEPIQVLVNLAAVTPRRREETPEGIERQFATNVLGYFWMIECLRPQLQAGAPSRVVNVASYWAGGLQLDDLEFRRRSYDNDAAYRQSKQADRMLAAAFAQRFSGDAISVNACHPGDVPSRLARNLGFGGHQSADEAADTPAWLATGLEGQTISGAYFAYRRREPCPFMRDCQAVETLFARCAEY